MRKLMIIVLWIIQLPCVIEGWLSSIMNNIVSGFGACCFPLAFISLVWWPLDMLCALLWAACEWLKNRLLEQQIGFNEAIKAYTNMFNDNSF